MCYRLHMKINPANKSNINFQSIIIPESIVRTKILKNLAEKEKRQHNKGCHNLHSRKY